MRAGSRPGWRYARRRVSDRSRGRPSFRLGDYHLGRPQLMISVSVSRPDDVDNRALRGAWLAVYSDGIVSGRVERRADVVATREAEAGQYPERLIPHAP